MVADGPYGTGGGKLLSSGGSAGTPIHWDRMQNAPPPHFIVQIPHKIRSRAAS